MFFKYLLVLAFAPAIFAWVLPCPDAPLLLPIEVRSDKCNNNLCELSSDVNIDMEVDFLAPNDITGFHPSGRLYFSGPDGNELYEPIRFPPEFSTGCDHLVGSECPISAGETRTWAIDWDWHREYMDTTITYGVEAKLYDSNEQAFACIRFQVRYTAP